MGLYFQKSSDRDIYWGVNISGYKKYYIEVFFTIFTHIYTKVLEEIIPFLHFLDAWKFLEVKKKWQKQ